MTFSWQAVLMQVVAAVVAGLVLAFIQGKLPWKFGTS